MSVLKNKNNTETETKTTINNKHITENVGLIEQQKILMIRDRSTPTQDESPKRPT